MGPKTTYVIILYTNDLLFMLLVLGAALKLEIVVNTFVFLFFVFLLNFFVHKTNGCESCEYKHKFLCKNPLCKCRCFGTNEGWELFFTLNPAYMTSIRLFIGCQHRNVLAPVPLTIFRSNLKFDQNLECSSLKCVLPITTKFCTLHDSVTVVTCAKFHCDRLSIF